MSKIRTEIEQYMDGPTCTDSTATSSFMFPVEFVGFQGHFPSKMVLPGACQIQCALSTIEQSLKQRVALREVLLAKFIAPVVPEERVTCTVSRAADGDSGSVIYRARFTKGTEKVTDLKLRVSLGDAR